MRRQVCIGNETDRASHSRGHLLRVLGVGFGIAIGVGSSIGSGIFRTPGTVAGQLGTPFLVFLVWSLGGVYSLLGSSTVAELGAMLPRAGGWYVYAHRAFGQKIGFVVGCLDWTALTVALSYLAVALGEFAVELFPALTGHAKAISIVGLLLLTLLNWIGLRPSSRAQELTSLAKGIGMVALVVACFLWTPRGGAAAFPRFLISPSHSFFFGLIAALQSVIITYDGWYSPIYFSEEDEDPGRNLPRSLIGTVLACMAIYLLMNAAMLHVLGMSHLSGSLVPAAETALAVFGSYGRLIILLISLLAVLSAANATLMITPRILFAMARDGFMPQVMTHVNEGGTPATALVPCALVSMALILSGTFETLIALASILYVYVYLSGFLALPALRRSEPDLARPYRVWHYPSVPLLLVAVSLAFLVAAVMGDWRHSLYSLVLILLSYIAALLITRSQT